MYVGHVNYMMIIQSSHLNPWKLFLCICSTLPVDCFGLYVI
jgi:hypothetical protein